MVRKVAQHAMAAHAVREPAHVARDDDRVGVEDEVDERGALLELRQRVEPGREAAPGSSMYSATTSSMRCPTTCTSRPRYEAWL